MARVTYLLGAGASFEALPLVKDSRFNGNVRLGFGGEMIALAQKFDDLGRAELLSPTARKQLDVLVTRMKELGQKAIDYSSPDTYLKSLFLKKGESIEVERSKMILSLFLTVKQLLAKSPDSRYIPFLASILTVVDGSIQIPNNIKILSWNYDFQLELALMYFEPLDGLVKSIQKRFNVIPNTDGTVTEPCVVHLNGVAGIAHGNGNSVSLLEERHHDEATILREFLRIFGFLDLNDFTINDSITFAWELKKVRHPRLNHAGGILSKTDILVVIGYSFPFFNKSVDAELLEYFSLGYAGGDRGDVRKIYIQNPSVDETWIEFFRESYKLPAKIPIIPLVNVDQFFLPPAI